MATTELDLGRYKLGWIDTVDTYVYRPEKGLNERVVREISWNKGEPDWMTNFRIRALRHFERKPMLEWFAKNMPDINFQDIYYYIKPTDKQVNEWDELPEQMKQTYEKLGIPEAERKYLAGVTAQYDSEVVYHKNREDLERQGILFTDMDTALREYPEVVKRWFGTVIPPNDNKFAALNSAVWSGGSFIYVPPGVTCEMPLQAYFRINSEYAGQFERTLIIADEGAQVHYIEGCSAPVYTNNALHSAVVELIALKGARITYTTIQNWSPNVYNLVTKRARADAEARVEWIDGNIGSKLTMKYPSVYLMGPKASGEVLSVAYAGASQHQDAGAKMYHHAPETTSTI
ncbi:MAG: Fe-S cluster assembly protein SufB, partial [Acidimicrobiales bacterium]